MRKRILKLRLQLPKTQHNEYSTKAPDSEQSKQHNEKHSLNCKNQGGSYWAMTEIDDWLSVWSQNQSQLGQCKVLQRVQQRTKKGLTVLLQNCLKKFLYACSWIVLQSHLGSYEQAENVSTHSVHRQRKCPRSLKMHGSGDARSTHDLSKQTYL